MLDRLADAKHRGEADVAALHDSAPLVARLRAEHLRQLRLELRPAVPVLEVALPLGAVEAGLFEQQGVELRLDRADGDVLAVGALVGVVEVGAAVEHVRAAVVLPHAGAVHADHGRQQERRTVGHRGVDDLALARLLRLQQTGDDAQGEEHAAAAEVAHQVERRHRPAAVVADRVEHAGEGDVVDVVTGGVGDRAVLSPAGHATEDELRIPFQADVGAEAEPFHDARSEPLDQAVGLLDHVEHRFDCLRTLEVHPQGAAATIQHIELRAASRIGPAVDADNLGAQVGQHHRAERPRSDAGDLENAVAVEWSHDPCLQEERCCGIEAGQYRRRLPYNPVRLRNRRFSRTATPGSRQGSPRPCSDTE